MMKWPDWSRFQAYPWISDPSSRLLAFGCTIPPMRQAPVALLLVLIPVAIVYSQQPADTALLEHARKLHKETPLIDGHNDYPWELRQKAQRDFSKLDISKPQPAVMTDIARLRAGGVGA